MYIYIHVYRATKEQGYQGNNVLLHGCTEHPPFIDIFFPSHVFLPEGKLVQLYLYIHTVLTARVFNDVNRLCRETFLLPNLQADDHLVIMLQWKKTYVCPTRGLNPPACHLLSSFSQLKWSCWGIHHFQTKPPWTMTLKFILQGTMLAISGRFRDSQWLKGFSSSSSYWSERMRQNKALKSGTWVYLNKTRTSKQCLFACVGRWLQTLILGRGAKPTEVTLEMVTGAGTAIWADTRCCMRGPTWANHPRQGWPVRNSKLPFFGQKKITFCHCISESSFDKMPSRLSTNMCHGQWPCYDHRPGYCTKVLRKASLPASSVTATSKRIPC